MKFNQLKEAKPIDLPADYTKLTQPQRAKVRERYVKLQKCLCWYCKEPLNSVPSKRVLSKPLNLNLFPSGFLRHPIHLHHDHNTGLTIGAVHSECNGYLWQYLNE